MGRIHASRALLCGIAVCLALLAPGWAVLAEGEEPATPGASAADPAKGKPQIQFADLEHDFGKAASGPELKATFEFKNVGDDVLVIEKVKGG